MDRSRHRRQAISAIAAASSRSRRCAAPIALRSSNPSPIVLLHVDGTDSAEAYAEMMRSGILQLVSGSPKDIPTVTDVSYFRCGLTGWAPKGVLVASEELFKSEFAERRLLPIFIRPVAVSTVAARAADLEKPGTHRRVAPRGQSSRRRRRVVLLPDPVVGGYDPATTRSGSRRRSNGPLHPPPRRGQRRGAQARSRRC